MGKRTIILRLYFYFRSLTVSYVFNNCKFCFSMLTGLLYFVAIVITSSEVQKQISKSPYWLWLYFTHVMNDKSTASEYS